MGMNHNNDRIELGRELHDGEPDRVCPVGVFVYGTLKTGQIREKCWPSQPTRIRNAWTFGKLFAGESYPAMTRGSDQVIGEVWFYDDDVIDEVLQTLDVIEGTNQAGAPNLYDRVIVSAFCANDNRELGTAYTYHYAHDPGAHGFDPIQPDGAGRAIWQP